MNFSIMATQTNKPAFSGIIPPMMTPYIVG